MLIRRPPFRLSYPQLARYALGFFQPQRELAVRVAAVVSDRACPRPDFICPRLSPALSALTAQLGRNSILRSPASRRAFSNLR